MLSFLLCILRKRRFRLISGGNTLALFAMASGLCKNIAERVSKECGLSNEKALEVILDGIKESQVTISDWKEG